MEREHHWRGVRSGSVARAHFYEKLRHLAYVGVDLKIKTTKDFSAWCQNSSDHVLIIIFYVFNIEIYAASYFQPVYFLDCISLFSEQHKQFISFIGHFLNLLLYISLGRKSAKRGIEKKIRY
jgi:hypothetical protein